MNRPESNGTPGVSPEFRTEPIAYVRPRRSDAPRNAFTVDVEDWYQSCVDYDAPITERVVRNVDRIQAVLDDCGLKGTFFVQGKVAEAFPELVSSLAAEGHEVQSHGYSHRPLYSMNRKQIRAELERAKKTVEDAAGTEVFAFRAQDFSIGASNMWVIEALAEAGFDVDSSIFPARARRYGIRGWPLQPHLISFNSGRKILEVPVAVWPLGPLRLPVAGGGYFRLLPRRLLERGLASIERSERPVVIYCHPYEFSSDELASFPEISRWRRTSQGLGRRSFAEQMRLILRNGTFGRFRDVLRAWNLR
jgi:polysaccharide deacetylase family protein (PEP-CTERM system associated)